MVIVPWSQVVKCRGRPLRLNSIERNVDCRGSGSYPSLMHRALTTILLCAVAYSASAQVGGLPRDAYGSPIWTPHPTLRFDSVVPEATIPKQMIAELRVSDVKVVLEDTALEAVEARLGGRIGSEGDAASSLSWLCLHGGDGAEPWVLWLESGEIDGPAVGSFQWQRVPSDARFDGRCSELPETKGKVELPNKLRLGESEAAVFKVLGTPTSRKGDMLFYEHQHDESIHGEPCTSTNIVIVILRDGVVWAIEVHQTTFS
jgi:hypothetical protein